MRMKTCPDCAESVQDAARKCRFCGFRFDEADAAASPTAEDGGADGGSDADPDEAPEDEPAPRKKAKPKKTTRKKASTRVASPGQAPAARAAAPAPAPAYSAPATWPFLLVALGGAAIAAGGLAMALVGLGHQDQFVGVLALGLPIGGIVLAIAFGVLMAMDRAGIGAVLGSLAIPAAAVLAHVLFHGDPATVDFSGLILTLGMIGCVFGCLDTLEELDMGGTRLAAQISLVGYGIQVISSLKSLDLPYWIQITLAVLGIGGMLLFGLGLTVGSLMRLGRP